MCFQLLSGGAKPYCKNSSYFEHALLLREAVKGQKVKDVFFFFFCKIGRKHEDLSIHFTLKISKPITHIVKKRQPIYFSENQR